MPCLWCLTGLGSGGLAPGGLSCLPTPFGTFLQSPCALQLSLPLCNGFCIVYLMISHWQSVLLHIAFFDCPSLARASTQTRGSCDNEDIS